MSLDQILQMITQYSNLVIYGLVFLPILVDFLLGLMHGFRKGATKFIFRLFVLLLFVLTLNPISKAIYNSSLFGQAGKIGAVLLDASSTDFTSIGSVIKAYLISFIAIRAPEYVAAVDTIYFYSLIDSIGVTIIKSVWVILYFTIILFIFFIIRVIIYHSAIKIKNRKERKRKKAPLVGAMFGILSGLLLTIVYMSLLSGVINLATYTKGLNDVVSASTSDAEPMSETMTIYLDEAHDSEVTIDVSGYMESVGNITQVLETANKVGSDFNNNFVIKGLNALKIKDKNGKQRGLLDANFDNLVYIEYIVKGDEEDLYVRMNTLEELGEIYDSVMYLVSTDGLIDSENKLHLEKITSESVERVFNSLSNVNVIRVGLAVGLSAGTRIATQNVTGLEISESDINKICNTDILGDVSKFGQVFGTLIDMGAMHVAGEYLNDKENFKMLSFLRVFTPKKGATETDEAYNARVVALRKKLTDTIKSFDILKTASDVAAPIVLNLVLNKFVEEYKLDDVNLNATVENQTYIEGLKSSINLGSDISQIFNIVYDLADFNGDDNKLQYIIENYTDLTSIVEGENAPFTMDDVSGLVNTLLGRLASISFIERGMDVGVKFLVENLKKSEGETQQKLANYLKEENIFANKIVWGDELGEKIPNIVNEVLKTGIIKLVMNTDSLSQNLWDKATGDGLAHTFSDTLDAMFSLALIENLEENSLAPLVKDYVSGISSAITIKISDNFGTEGHKIKDELYNVLVILDDLIDGAAAEGATSFDSIFGEGNMNVLLSAVSNIDPSRVEVSSILAPTLIHYLSTMDNETIKVPYIYTDEKWYSHGEAKGEIYNLIESIKTVVNLDAIKNMFIDGASSDSSSLLNVLKGIKDDDLNKLLSSATIKNSLTGLLDSVSDSSTSIVITSSSTENMVISNYKDGDDVTITSDTILDEEGNEVHLAQKKVISNAEMLRVLSALRQITSLDDLTNSGSILETAKSLNGPAVDENGHEIAGKTKAEVLFTSNILRETASKLIVGENYSVEYLSLPRDAFALSDDNYYITKEEFLRLFDSINILSNETGLSTLDALSVDSFLAIGSLPNATKTKLLASLIFRATLTDKITSAFSSESAFKIIIPYTVLEHSYEISKTGDVISFSNTSMTLTLAEGVSLIDATSYIDFNSLSSDAFNVFSSFTGESKVSGKTVIEAILESKIMHATISEVVRTMSSGTMSIYIPSSVLDLSDNFILSGDTKAYKYDSSKENPKVEMEKGVIKASEIVNLAKAASLINISSFGSGDDSFNAIKSLSDPISLKSSELKVDEIIKSDILKATMSDYILKMSVSNIEINVPYNDDVLAKNGTTYEFDNISSAEQDKVLMIKDSELRKFIIAASILDLSGLSDPLNTITKLGNTTSLKIAEYIGKTNIYAIMQSDILKASISDYIVTNSSTFGFSNLVLPLSVLSSEEKVKLSVTSGHLSETTSYIPVIDADELEAMVVAVNYIDLNSIASNTLSILAELNAVTPGGPTILELAYSSEILKYTLTSQFVSTAGDGSLFYIPKQAFGDLFTKEDYESINTSTGVISSKAERKALVSLEEFTALVNALSVIDLENIDATALMNITLSTFNNLIQSKIILANIAKAFTSALMSNTDVGAVYTANIASLEDNEIEYSVANDYSTWENTLKKQEIIDIFNSLKLLNTTDVEGFSIKFEQLYAFIDDGTLNDDLRSGDSTDERAKFLRSILVRLAMMKNLEAIHVWDPSDFEDAAAYIKVSALTNYEEAQFSAEHITLTDSSVTLTGTTLSWVAPTYPASAVTFPVDTRVYEIFVNGALKVKNTDTFSATSITLAELGISTTTPMSSEIKIVAEGLDSSTKIYKPVIYDVYTYNVTSVLSAPANVSINNADLSVSFDLVPNATDYTVRLINKDDPTITVTKSFSQKYSATSKTISFAKLISTPGEYTVEITPRSSNSSYLTEASSVYTSPVYLLYKSSLNALRLEVSDGELLIEKDGTYPIMLTIGANDYLIDGVSEFYTTFVTAHDNYYSLDLEALHAALKIVFGNNTITIKQISTYNTVTETTKTLTYIPKTSGITIEEGVLKINPVTGASKFEFRIYREGETDSCFYKTIILDTDSEYKCNISILSSDYKYTYKVVGVNTDNMYYAETYVLVEE